jgi:hypothetical protein
VRADSTAHSVFVEAAPHPNPLSVKNREREKSFVAGELAIFASTI